jgi:hypothetical protein
MGREAKTAARPAAGRQSSVTGTSSVPPTAHRSPTVLSKVACPSPRQPSIPTTDNRQPTTDP